MHLRPAGLPRSRPPRFPGSPATGDVPGVAPCCWLATGAVGTTGEAIAEFENVPHCLDLAGLFIYGGIDTVRDPGPRAEQAAALLARLRRVLFMPDDLMVVRLNAAVQATAGVAMATGVASRWGAGILAASLVPTTLAGHPFWELPPGPQRHEAIIPFLSNAAVLGGLLALVIRPAPTASAEWPVRARFRCRRIRATR